MAEWIKFCSCPSHELSVSVGHAFWNPQVWHQARTTHWEDCLGEACESDLPTKQLFSVLRGKFRLLLSILRELSYWGVISGLSGFPWKSPMSTGWDTLWLDNSPWAVRRVGGVCCVLCRLYVQTVVVGQWMQQISAVIEGIWGRKCSRMKGDSRVCCINLNYFMNINMRCWYHIGFFRFDIICMNMNMRCWYYIGFLSFDHIQILSPMVYLFHYQLIICDKMFTTYIPESGDWWGWVFVCLFLFHFFYSMIFFPLSYVEDGPNYYYKWCNWKNNTFLLQHYFYSLQPLKILFDR